MLAVCREPLYRQKSPSREGAGSSGSYQVPEVRGSRGRRVHATNSTAGATLVRARQDVKRARQASAPALLPSIFPGPTASRVVSLQWVWMGGEVREGTAALSAEDLSLGRREGILFRSPGILGRGCWQGGCRRGLWLGLRVVVSCRSLRRACTTLRSSGLSGPLHHAGLASLGQVAQVAVSLGGCCIPSGSLSLSTSAS